VVWTLRHADQIERVPIQPRITANSLIFCRDAAIAGAGVAAIPAFVVRDALADGQLQRVLPEWMVGIDPISVVYPSRRQLPPRTRAFIDTLIRAFEQIAL
jgi:DNA-binding transcriptional LysR family regulator